MSDQSQPREFWINTITKEVHLGPLKGADGNVRVVEYSFLENAEAKIKALEEADENRIDLNLHVSLMEEIAKARDQLKSEIEAQAQELASLRADNQRLKRSYEDAYAEANSANHRCDSLKVELAKANTKEFAANLKIDELRAENEILRSKASQFESTMVATIFERDKLKVELSEATEELTNRSQALANLNSDWLEARGEIDSLKAEVEGYEKNLKLYEESIRHSFKEREDALKAKLEAAEKEIERLKSQMDEAGLKDLQAGEFYVVYHKNHPDPAEAFVAKFKEFETLNNRYRTALDVAVTELRRLNMDAPIELTIHTGQVLVGITEIIADAPETGPSKDAVIESLVDNFECDRSCQCCMNNLAHIEPLLEAAKGKV